MYIRIFSLASVPARKNASSGLSTDLGEFEIIMFRTFILPIEFYRGRRKSGYWLGELSSRGLSKSGGGIRATLEPFLSRTLYTFVSSNM